MGCGGDGRGGYVLFVSMNYFLILFFCRGGVWVFYFEKEFEVIRIKSIGRVWVVKGYIWV